MPTFGEMLKERRKALRLGLRAFALRADVDPGNVSKMERGKLQPPQTANTLDRMCLALEWNPDTEDAIRLKDQAALEAGRIPDRILSDEELMAKLPVFLRTMENKRLTSDQIDRLIEMIREA